MVSSRQPYTQGSDRIQTRHHNCRSFTVSYLPPVCFQQQKVNHFEIYNEIKSGWACASHKQRLGCNSNSTRQLQILHMVILTRCKFSATMMVNNSEIFNKIKSGEKATTINKMLGYKWNSTPQLHIVHSVILTSCMFPATIMVNHSQIFNKTK